MADENYFMTNLFERYAAVYRLELAAPGLKSSYWSSVNVSWTFFFPTNEMMSPFSMCLKYMGIYLPRNFITTAKHVVVDEAIKYFGKYMTIRVCLILACEKEAIYFRENYSLTSRESVHF